MRTVNISDLKAQLRDGEEVLVCDRKKARGAYRSLRS